AVAVLPSIAGAGIKQYADGGEIDGDASPLDGVDVETRRQLAPTIDTADREVPPAAVIRNPQIGIVRARHLGDVSRDRRQPALVEREMWGAAVGDPAVDHAATLAHGGGAAQLGKLVGAFGFGRCWCRRLRADWHHSSKPRPTVPA